MRDIKPYKLTLIKQEKHLLLPRITSIVLTQNLYDVLFQYVITSEKEVKLEKFIKQMETHIKSKSRAPFSAPLEELGFLDDGLEELRLLNWMEVPVCLYSVEFMNTEDTGDEEWENLINFLEEQMVLKALPESKCIYVYPMTLTSY
ncbi:MAG: hypothetical protein ACOX6L_01845 [Syntrophomonadaceae bacterium]